MKNCFVARQISPIPWKKIHAKARHLRCANVFYFTTKAPRNYTEAKYEGDVFIMFGKESAGLPEELLFANRSHCVRIPMRESLRSLNLSNSVAIAVYEVLRQWDYPELLTKGNLTKYNWE